MDFRLLRGSQNSAPMEDLNFSMLLIEYSVNRLVLQSVFDQPLSVSIGSLPDILRVEIVDPSLFISAESGKTLLTESIYETPIYGTNLI